MVQSAPKIVYDITRCRKGAEGDMVDKDLARKDLFGLNLNLSARSVVVESCEASLHIAEVLLGPLNLGADKR